MRFVAQGPERLDRFLARCLPQFSRSRLAAWIAQGRVLVDGATVKPGLMLKSGTAVDCEPLEERPAHDLAPHEMALDVLYEDDDVLVVNKPRGLATHPAPTLREPSLVNVLLARGGSLSVGSAAFRPGIVHRLDKETTGLIVIAKSDRAHQSLARQFASKRAERRYLAVVAGDLEQERITIDAPLARDKRNRLLMAVDPEGKPAVTHLVRLKRLDRGTLLEARLETGRTHQIRAHLRAIGHPVLGDSLYSNREHQGVPLQLHAYLLSFGHPTSGERMSFQAEPPDDFLGQGGNQA